MSRLNRPQRTVRWMVLLLWAMSMLAPAVVQAAMAWRLQAQPWAVVCASAGADGQVTHSSGTGADSGHEHCPGCLPRLDPPAPAPAMVAMLPGPAPARWLPPPHRPAPASTVAWQSAQPRAPPLSA